jgi:hypothetical protein
LQHYPQLAPKAKNIIPSRAEAWREARLWYERSLAAYAYMSEHDMLQGKDDISSSDEVRRAIAHCNDELRKR